MQVHFATSLWRSGGMRIEAWHSALAAGTLIRKKVYRLSNDKRKEFRAFSTALLEVLT